MALANYFIIKTYTYEKQLPLPSHFNIYNTQNNSIRLKGEGQNEYYISNFK